MTQITQIIGMSATLKNPIDPLNLRHLRSFVQQTITNRNTSVQLKI